MGRKTVFSQFCGDEVGVINGIRKGKRKDIGISRVQIYILHRKDIGILWEACDPALYVTVGSLYLLLFLHFYGATCFKIVTLN